MDESPQPTDAAAERGDPLLPQRADPAGGAGGACAGSCAGLDCEILVVDSTGDGRAARLARRHPPVTVIEPPGRLSCGAARNAGAGQARGDYLLFLDADCVPAEGWGRGLREALARGHDVLSGAIANGTPDSRAGTLQFWTEFSRFCPSSRAGHHSFIPSFQLLIRRGLFQSAPPYAEEFLLAEDLIFFTRLRERGIEPGFHPAMVVRHLNRQSFPEVFRHLYRIGAGSGRARALHRGIRGSFLRWLFPALPLLLPYSWLGLAVRLGRAPGLAAGRKLGLLLLAAPGLACWHAGFACGLLFPRAAWFPPATARDAAAGTESAAEGPAR